MNKTLSTILIVFTGLLLAGGIFFAGSMYARANAYGPAMMFGNGWNNNIYGPSMMGQAGMMNGRGGMMNRYYDATNLTPLTIDQAKAAAEKYLANLNNSDLTIGEIMIFDNNAYVVVKEANTGLGAFELLVDPVSQVAYPEHGPNMMWNLKYGGLNHNGMMSRNGMMGGMMGGTGMMSGWDYQTTPAKLPAELIVTPEQAVGYAQQYLDQYQPGSTTATDAAQFYGYYTLDFEKDGKIIGMLSVNGYGGQVFVHTWHGTFIEDAE